MYDLEYKQDVDFDDIEIIELYEVIIQLFKN